MAGQYRCCSHDSADFVVVWVGVHAVLCAVQVAMPGMDGREVSSRKCRWSQVFVLAMLRHLWLYVLTITVQHLKVLLCVKVEPYNGSTCARDSPA